MYAPMLSRSFKCFSLPYRIINFLFVSLKLLTNLKKCLLKPISVDFSMFPIANLSLAAGKMRKYKFVTGSFPYDFTESHTASCVHVQCQNRCFRVFEVGYWKEAAKTLSYIFSSTRKQKLLNHSRMFRKY